MGRAPSFRPICRSPNSGIATHGGDLYFRNGACYALRRATLLETKAIFGEQTLPYVIDRPLVNIDELLELELAEFLLARRARELQR